MPLATMARMRLRALLPALLAVAVLLLAGCGGGSEEDFQTDVVAARNRTDAALTQLVAAKSMDDFLKRAKIAATEIRGAASDVHDADAPDQLGDETDALESALRELSDDLVNLVDSYEVAPETFANASGFNFESWDKVQKQLTALRKAGIAVPPLERLKAPG